MFDTLFSQAKGRGGTILCFHEIAPAKFVRWMRQLSQQFRLVSLDEMIQRRLGGQSLSGLLAITFDDGWVESCAPIAEICEREEWPITIYAISSLCDSTRTFWFAELPELLASAHESSPKISNGASTTQQPAFKPDRTLPRLLRTLPGEEALRTVHQFRAELNLPPDTNKRPRFIDRNFIEHYARSEWISFGSHTVDHQCLSAQTEERLEWQLETSKATLEELTGKPVKHFCYPYGDPASIGKLAPAAVKRHYSSATTMLRGVCGKDSDPHYLPRVPLYNSDSHVRGLMKVALAPWL